MASVDCKEKGLKKSAVGLTNPPTSLCEMLRVPKQWLPIQWRIPHAGLSWRRDAWCQQCASRAGGIGYRLGWMLYTVTSRVTVLYTNFQSSKMPSRPGVLQWLFFIWELWPGAPRGRHFRTFQLDTIQKGNHYEHLREQWTHASARCMHGSRFASLVLSSLRVQQSWAANVSLNACSCHLKLFLWNVAWMKKGKCGHAAEKCRTDTNMPQTIFGSNIVPINTICVLKIPVAITWVGLGWSIL